MTSGSESTCAGPTASDSAPATTLWRVACYRPPYRPPAGRRPPAAGEGDRNRRAEEREPYGSVRPRDGLHPGGHADQVRPRRRRTTRAGSSSGSAWTRVMLVTDPGVARPRPSRTGSRRSSRREGIEVVRLRPRPRRADGRVLPGRRATSRSRRRSTGSCRSAAGRASTPRRSSNLIIDPPGAGHGLRQPAGRRRARSRRRRCGRTSRSRRRRGTGAEATTVAVLDIPEQQGQDRDLAPLPAPDAGDRRPRARRARCRPR